MNRKLKGSGGKETAKSWAGAVSGCGYGGMRNAIQRVATSKSSHQNLTKKRFENDQNQQKSASSEEKVAVICRSDGALLI